MSLAVATVAAFTAGLAGAAHCLAMCGAISVALSRASPPQAGFVVARQLGRVASYTLAGAAMGGLGQTLLLVGQSGTLRLALQVLFALSWLWLAARLIRPNLRLPWASEIGGRLWSRLQPLTRRFLPASTAPRAFALGALWGFMPCGLSYAMLMIAATQGSALGGAAIMAAFGLASTFALGALDLGARRVDQVRLSPWLRGLGAAVALALAGLSLWLPYKYRGHAHDHAVSMALAGDDYCVK
jgi:sulfite exporter TauE/SafE